MGEDASLPEVGNSEQNEPEECICTVHCPGPGVEGTEEPLSLICGSQPVEMGSVVGVESIREYPHHYGSGQGTHRCSAKLSLPKRVWSWAG